MRRLCFAIAILALAPVASWAQAPQNSWENLRKLDVGHKTRIVDMNLKSWVGKLVGVSEESITIRSKEGDVTVARADVLRVTDLERSKRARNALIGYAIGSGIGVAVGLKSETDVAAAVMICAFLGGGTGLAAGALIPYPGPTVYRAKQRPAKVTGD